MNQPVCYCALSDESPSCPHLRYTVKCSSCKVIFIADCPLTEHCGVHVVAGQKEQRRVMRLIEHKQRFKQDRRTSFRTVSPVTFGLLGIARALGVM